MTMFTSKNNIMAFIAHRAYQNVNGSLGRNLVHITRYYNLSFQHFSGKCQSQRLKKHYEYEHEAICIKELRKCIEGTRSLYGFDRSEVLSLIDAIADS